jgi:alpha-L-fucosidase
MVTMRTGLGFLVCLVWHKKDNEWKSPETLVRTLVDVASKGGNFLLNVGPTGEGLIPAPSLERLAEVGRWMKVNGEGIQGTAACPFGAPAWGRCTAKATAAGASKLYLHVFDWPADGKLELPPLEGGSKVVSASLLAGGKKVSVEQPGDGRLVLALPGKAPDALSSTVVVNFRVALAQQR